MQPFSHVSLLVHRNPLVTSGQDPYHASELDRLVLQCCQLDLRLRNPHSTSTLPVLVHSTLSLLYRDLLIWQVSVTVSVESGTEWNEL